MKNNLVSVQSIFTKDLSLRIRLEYLLTTLLGVFFTFLTFFTISKVIYLISYRLNVLPADAQTYVLLTFAAIIFIEASTAYGFLYSRPWIKYIISVHALSIIITGMLVLPKINMDFAVNSTLTNGIPYYLMGIGLWFFSTLKGDSKFNILVPALYTFSITTVIVIQLFMYR